MVDCIVSWMRSSDPERTLRRAAAKLGDCEIQASTIPSIPEDFWGAVVFTYEAGCLVSIEKRSLS